MLRIQSLWILTSRLGSMVEQQLRLAKTGRCRHCAEGFSGFGFEFKVYTHRLKSSSFGGLPYRILDMNHKKELLWRLWVSQRSQGLRVYSGQGKWEFPKLGYLIWGPYIRYKDPTIYIRVPYSRKSPNEKVAQRLPSKASFNWPCSFGYGESPKTNLYPRP